MAAKKKSSKRKKAVQYGPIYDPAKAGRRGRGRPRGSKGKAKAILAPLKGKHHIKLEGEVFIKG